FEDATVVADYDNGEVRGDSEAIESEGTGADNNVETESKPARQVQTLPSESVEPEVNIPPPGPSPALSRSRRPRKVVDYKMYY
ncbi:unnamed protein product, partial [Arctia plantaginis]